VTTTETVEKDRAVTVASVVVALILILVAGLILNLFLLVQVRNQRAQDVANQLALLDCLTPGPTPVEAPDGKRFTGHACFDAEQNRAAERARLAEESRTAAVRRIIDGTTSVAVGQCVVDGAGDVKACVEQILRGGSGRPSDPRP